MTNHVKIWNEKAVTLLKDQKVVLVEYAADSWVKALGINARPLTITFENGWTAIVMSDDEGNDAGALHMYHPDQSYEVLPTLR